MSALTSCPACGATLGPWEHRRCGCATTRGVSTREVLYAAACTTSQPLRIGDFTRLAEAQFASPVQRGTAAVALSSDNRFCWAGQGLYGLYRHGPIPGARNLEQASRVVLVAARAPLTGAAIDFVLKQLGYRFHPGSLTNALNRSRHIRWRRADGHWQHPVGEDAERTLCRTIPVVPDRHPDLWEIVRDRLHAQVHGALQSRQGVIRGGSAPDRYGINWDTDTI